MKSLDRKKFMPHIIAIAVFLIIALMYCKPALEGKVLQQQDIVQWLAMSKDQRNVEEKTGHVPLWSNGMFSGMPGYLIMGNNNNVLPYYFVTAISFGLPKPVCFFFLACICFYFLSQVLRVNPYIGIMGALCYGYATFNPVIIVAGHDTQMYSVALLPALLASLMLIYDKKYWVGVGLTALFTSALISENHYQTMYYGVLIAVFMTIGYLIHWIINKEWKHLFIAAALTIAAAIIGVLSNAVVLFTNYEYAQETIRSGSNLGDEHATKTGLTQDYAFSYSMFKSEPFVMMVPRMFGGSSGISEVPEEKSKAVEALQNMPQQLAQQLQGGLSYYWGGIGGTQGPPYIGAIICFLAILGFVVLDNKHKWWILTACVITVIMSWGGYFKEVNGWLLDHLPGYNKFRAPSFLITVPTVLLGMMAIMSLNKILFEVNDKTLLWKQFKKALLITAGIFILLLFMYMNFDYQSDGDKSILQRISSIQDAQVQSAIRSFFSGLSEDRKSLFLGDIFRSLIFIAIAAAAIWACFKNKLKPLAVALIITVFAFIDIMAIDVNYLNSSNYIDSDEYQSTNFQPTPADVQIMKDTGFYRVLDLTHGGIQGAFNQGALTSYFHKSIGGYHPAKLSIYQDLIEKQLYNFPNCLPVLNMLNTKYIISGDNPQNPQVQQNPGALGDVWFVNAIRFVNGPKEEMDALTNFNPKDTAVAEQSFSNVLRPDFKTDTSASIRLVSNENDLVTYHSKSPVEQMAVFSEVYYDKGWKVYIDEKEAPYAKVDYVLRGMMVPAGEHTIVFKFDPASHRIGWQLTSIFSIIMILLLIAAIFLEIKKRRTLIID